VGCTAFFDLYLSCLLVVIVMVMVVVMMMVSYCHHDLRLRPAPAPHTALRGRILRSFQTETFS
jgi:hypothetical protein